MSHIAFVFYAQQPALTPADAAALNLLAARGHQTQAVVWDDPAVDWASFDSIVIRSTWDYHTQPAAFQRWLTHLASLNAPLWNPTSIIQWNMNKRYLQELAKTGTKIADTLWLTQGQAGTLQEIIPDWKKIVVKPVISAEARDTHLLNAAQVIEFQPKFEALLAKGDLILQKFMPQIQTEGEWSLVFFNKEYSHAVLKQPKKGDFRVQASFGGGQHAAKPQPHMIAQAQAILAKVTAPLLYARVDGLNVNGDFVLMELELIEPYLFLEEDPEATQRFATAIEQGIKP